MKILEFCQHCGGEYTPKRRGAQKFCSNSCRSRHWQLKKYTEKKDIVVHQQSNPNSQKHKVDKMSVAGVGNAAAGAAIVELGKNVLGVAAATKKDIQELKSFIKGRYLPVNNAGKDSIGRSAYYDVETGDVVYLYR